MNPETHQPNSLAGLLHNLRDETTTLLRQEVALAKAELSEKASNATKHAVQIGIGGAVGLLGAIVLLFGIADFLGFGLTKAGLAPDISYWLARVLVGVAVAVTGYLMIAKAKKAIADEKLVPEQTLQSLRTNKQWAETKLQKTHESTS